MSVRKRVNIMYNRIDAAKRLFMIFGGSEDTVKECDDLLLEMDSLSKLAKNPEKAQIRLQNIILRAEDVLSKITKSNWDKYKEHLKDKEKEKEYLRKLESVKQEEYINKVTDIILKSDNIPNTLNSLPE